jgi:hypothetical protein
MDLDLPLLIPPLFTEAFMTDSNLAADLTLSFRVPQNPMEVFEAINRVGEWWIDAVFTYEYKPYHRTVQQVVELVPGKRVVWKVLESSINFVEDKEEWKDTLLVFDIADKGGETEVRFTHAGLTPKLACYGNCSAGWNHYIEKSLPSLIVTGEGIDPKF